MSGPKVPRIKTKKEFLREASRTQKNLEQVQKSWIKKIDKEKIALPTDAQMLDDMNKTMKTLLQKEEWKELNRYAVTNIKWFDSELAERSFQKTENERLEKNRLKKRNDLVKVLAKKIEEIPDSFSKSDKEAFEKMVQKEIFDETLDRIWNNFFDQQAAESNRELNQTQLEVIHKLGITGPTEKFLSRDYEKNDDTNRELESINPLLDEARMYLTGKEIKEINDNLIEILGESEKSIRRIRLSSIFIDMKTILKKRKDFERLKTEVTVLRDELATLDDKGLNYSNLLRSAALTDDYHLLSKTVLEAKRYRDKYYSANDWAEKKDILLDGLRKLGYEISAEEMKEEFDSKNGLVISDSSDDSVGIEFKGYPNADKFSVKVVRYENSEDIKSDIEHEEAWCQKFSKLSQHLDIQGHRIEVLNELAVGQAPLQKVERKSIRGVIRKKSKKKIKVLKKK